MPAIEANVPAIIPCVKSFLNITISILKPEH